MTAEERLDADLARDDARRRWLGTSTAVVERMRQESLALQGTRQRAGRMRAKVAEAERKRAAER